MINPGGFTRKFSKIYKFVIKNDDLDTMLFFPIPS